MKNMLGHYFELFLKKKKKRRSFDENDNKEHPFDLFSFIILNPILLYEKTNFYIIVHYRAYHLYITML